MTIPTGDVHSASDWLSTVVDELRALPPVRDFTEITALWTLLKEQKKQNVWPAQEDLDLLRLQTALLKTRSLAAKWKKARVRLLFEPSTFVKELSNTFIDIRRSFDQLLVSSKDQIVEQLDKVIEDLSYGGACIGVKHAETDFKKQFFDFLRGKRSKSDTSGEAISVCAWLAEQLVTDVGSIKLELEGKKENEGSFLEELLLYVAVLEGERACTSDRPLGEVARSAVRALGEPQMHWVLAGFEDLTRCTQSLNGKLAVFTAHAIPEAIRLAQTNDGLYVTEAMILLEALTSSRGAGDEDVRVIENRNIYLHVSNHLDFLIALMKNSRHPDARLLAAETVVNMLVNSQVWQTVRIQHDIVSALVAISNEGAEDQSIHDWNRADRVCLVGLRHLTEFSPKSINLDSEPAGDKTLIIVTALMKLLREGLCSRVLMNLAKDTLVALDTQVLSTDHRTPTLEVCLRVRGHLLERMLTNDFISHSTIPGRMAIISVMEKLCGLYEEGINEGFFLYLLKMMKKTGCEIMECSNSGEDWQKVNDLKKLLGLSVKLLCFCVNHGKDTAQAVLTKNVAERKTLEAMLEEQNSGILDESKLQILEIFDKIDMESSSQGPTAVGEVAVLVKMAKSPSPACRAQVASRFLKLVEEKLHETEMQEAGGINALMDLLKEENVDCQKDALLALYLLSQNNAIQTEELPFQTILVFLHSKWPSNVRDAAVGFLDLMIKENAANAKGFMETPESLKAALHCLDKDAENPSSQKCAYALLNMATEEGADVRLGIAYAGLSILVKFVRRHGTVEHKELLTTMLSLLCKRETGCEEAVIKAGGHTFLLKSLQENISKEAAAQGLLSLLNNARTQGDVLETEFVEAAMGSIDRKSASTEMALGLASICYTPYGLDRIVACPHSVGALLILLERCPTSDGKGAAAAVIAKLYPRLNTNEDPKRPIELTEACSHLIKYIDQEDKSQLEEFLKALAAFATGKKGRQTIHEERGQIRLIRFLKSREIGTQVRDLVLQILAEMSSVFPENIRDSSYHKILNVFLDNKIGELLCPLPYDEEFKRNEESMKNLLILIRNLSLAGLAACVHLSDSAAVPMLLKVLTDHGSSLSPVTELAVKALVKFVDDPNGKKEFLTGGGIRSLVAVLKLDCKSSDVKSISTIILASVAQDPRTGRVACESIFNCDILQPLNNIIFEGETSRIKWQAAVLMKLLVTNGPTQKVCAAIYQAGTLDALGYLRTQKHCDEIADDILKFVKGRNSSCRRYIEEQSRVKPK